MKKRLNSTILFVAVLCFTFKQAQTQSDKINVTIVADSIPFSSKTAAIFIKIANLTPGKLTMPEKMSMSLNKNDSNDFTLEVQKKQGGDYTKVLMPDNQTIVPSKNALIKLPEGKNVAQRFDIASFFSYDIPKGEYRLRVLYLVSKHNKIEDMYSNWLDFAIK